MAQGDGLVVSHYVGTGFIYFYKVRSEATMTARGLGLVLSQYVGTGFIKVGSIEVVMPWSCSFRAYGGTRRSCPKLSDLSKHHEFRGALSGVEASSIPTSPSYFSLHGR